MTELTLMSLIEALGGWDIVVRAAASVALTGLIQAGIKTAGKDLNPFLKRGTGFIGAAVVALLWSGTADLSREVLVNWFCSTVLWNVALKPMVFKFGEGWRPSGGQ
jgi:hypothetical protein